MHEHMIHVRRQQGISMAASIAAEEMVRAYALAHRGPKPPANGHDTAALLAEFNRQRMQRSSAPATVSLSALAAQCRTNATEGRAA